MATVTSSSRRSSSSYRSSARYSTSSTYHSEGSLGGSCDSLEPLFEPFLDSSDPPSLFGDEESRGSRHSRPSYGHSGERTDEVESFSLHRSVVILARRVLLLLFEI